LHAFFLLQQWEALPLFLILKKTLKTANTVLKVSLFQVTRILPGYAAVWDRTDAVHYRAADGSSAAPAATPF